MADQSITASDFVPSATATLNRTPQKAGVAIAAGEVVYLDSATTTLKLAQADGTTAEAAAVGWAGNSAAANQYVTVVTADKGDIGCAVGGARTEGVALFLSGTPGKMCLYSDLASTNKIVFLGYYTSATTASLLIDNCGETIGA
jgi:hypothetical protein